MVFVVDSLGIRTTLLLDRVGIAERTICYYLAFPRIPRSCPPI